MSTPEDRFERTVSDLLAEIAPTRPPDSLIPDAEQAVDRARRWPRWLALIKEPPMRISPSVAVGSPMARVAAIGVATLLLALLIVGAGIAGSRLIAADGTIVVDQSGNGTTTTITEAVAMARDGDSILVKPGVYPESITITEDISIRGEDRDSVIIEFGGGCSFDEAAEEWSCSDDTPMYDGYWHDPEPFGILLDGSDAEVSDLTVRAPLGTWITVKGGDPSIHHVFADHPRDRGGSLYIHDGSTAMVKDSLLEGWVFLEEQSPATLEGNTVGQPMMVNTSYNTSPSGGPSTIRGNRANGGIVFGGSALIEGNEIHVPDIAGQEPGDAGIHHESGDGWVVRDNTLTGQRVGIQVGSSSAGTIEDNRLIDNQTGISVLSSDAILDGNAIEGGDVGIVTTGGSPTLRDNSIEGASRGLVIGFGTSPTLTGNTVCGNETNLDAYETLDTTGNEICEDAATVAE